MSVVVPTWNRASFLEGCLETLLTQEYAGPFEILVADDGSTDATTDVVRRLAATDSGRIRYLRLGHAGPSAARNQGIAVAQGDIVCFVDDDEIVPQGHLARVAACLSSDQRLAGVGGPYRDEPPPRACSDCSSSRNPWSSAQPHLIASLQGGNMAVRRWALEAVGGFDENLRGRGEDSEWFSRATGLSFRFDPEIFVWHRRASRGIPALCITAFRQGLGVPAYRRVVGRAGGPDLALLLRFLLHALRRRCSNGVIRASREAGTAVGYLREAPLAQRLSKET